MVELVAPETYVPEQAGDAALAEVSDFLEARRAARGDGVEQRYLLVGADTHEQVEIPEDVHRVLVQVVEAMRRGFAVTVSPLPRVLTTQQAADLLGISRPTLVRLLEAGRIPFETAGTSHRRLRLVDVLDYRERRRQEQHEALAAMSVEEDPVDATDLLRGARKEVAARRRAAR